ncbi:sensor histidine kinase [Propioniciclava tarda]|nr:ATP-binding protein [Propioniciclava tarda]
MGTRTLWVQETLAGRLMLGQTIVLLASVLTAGLVASIVGPPIFHGHLTESGHAENSPELAHIELAYQQASAVALGVALFTSLACAIVVTWFVSRRLRQPLDELTDAARELSRGHYARRVPTMGGGTELETLGAAFNTMASRLEDIENTRRRLLSDLAHELRTPIATLALYHEGLFDGITDLGVDTQTVLTSQTARLTRLADDIDDVSRAEEGRLSLERASCLVGDLLLRSAEAARGRYQDKGVDLTLDLGETDGLSVNVDPNRIGQVLGNLLANSLRHTPPGGHVTISGRPQPQGAVITVADDGDGIPADQLTHVFERFYRGDTARSRESSGSGIGLTISKAIVDAHGGTIGVVSDGSGRGAVFNIVLPRAA